MLFSVGMGIVQVSRGGVEMAFVMNEQWDGDLNGFDFFAPAPSDELMWCF